MFCHKKHIYQSIVVLILENTSKLFMKDTRKFIPLICIYFDIVAFSTVVAFNRFQERGFIHIVAFHRLALVRRGNNLGGISQYDLLEAKPNVLPSNYSYFNLKFTCTWFSPYNYVYSFERVRIIAIRYVKSVSVRNLEEKKHAKRSTNP